MDTSVLYQEVNLMSSANKAVVARLYDEMINQENMAVIDDIFAPDVVIHDPIMGTVQGVGAFKQLIGLFNAAFPGHRVTVHHIIAEGDTVAVLHTHYGVHGGDFMGLPPTGKHISVNGVEWMRMADGRIADFYRHDDDAGILQQLGLVPSAAPA